MFEWCQLTQHVACPLTTTEDPERLTEEFPKWLEKVSCRLSGGIVLVIDAVDLCQVVTSLLHNVLLSVPLITDPHTVMKAHFTH